MHLISLRGSRLDTAQRRDCWFRRAAARGPAARPGRRPGPRDEPGERRPPAGTQRRAGAAGRPPPRFGRAAMARSAWAVIVSDAPRKILPISNMWFRGQPGPLRRRQIDVRVRAEQRGHPVGVSGLPGRIKFGQNALFVRAEPASGRRGPSPRRAPPPRAPPPRSRPPGASRRGLLLRGELPRGDRAGQPDATTPPLRQRGDQHGHHHDGAYSQDHPQPPCAGPARLHTAKPCHARNPW